MMQRPELTLLERTYLPQVVDGLRVTTRHFLRNLAPTRCTSSASRAIAAPR